MGHYYDTIIIGGGVIGTSTAYFLSKAGQKILLLERTNIADGSSSKCDGNIQVGDSPFGIDTEIICKSLTLFPEVVKDLDMDVHWKKTDSMYVFETEEEIEAGKILIDEKARQDVKMRLLDAYEVHEQEPNLASDIKGGILTEEEGMINPMLLCIGLARRAEQYGAVIKKNSEVTDIVKTEDGFIVQTVEQEYRARKVIAAAGVWTPQIGGMLGLTIPIIPRQGQILVSDIVRNFVNRTVTEFGYIMTKQENMAFVRDVPPEMEEFGIAALAEPTEGGTLLIGSSRQFTGYNTNNDDRVIRAMARRICRFFPKIADINMIRCYAGLRPYTADHRPIISETSIKDFYVASGHEGSGIALSVITGKMMEGLLIGQPCGIDIEPFRFSRFSI